MEAVEKTFMTKAVDLMKDNKLAIAYMAFQTVPQVVNIIDRNLCQRRQHALIRENQAAHQKLMERMAAENTAFQKELREDREKSGKRFKELHAARTAQLEKWKAEQDQLQIEHDEKIEKFRKENMEQLERYRETFKTQQKSSQEIHEQKMTSKSEKNDREVETMNKKQESAKKEGDEKFKAEMKFIDETIQEIKVNASQQNETMLQVFEKYRKENDELREKNLELSKQAAEEKRTQLKEQYELMIQEKAQESVSLEQNIRNQAIENMLRKYQEVVMPLDNAIKAIGEMEESYKTGKYNPSTIQKGALDCHKVTVRQAGNDFQFEIGKFRQSLFTSINAPAEFRKLLIGSLAALEKCLNQAKLSQTCALFTSAYENGDFETMDTEMRELINFKDSFDRVKSERILMIMESQNQGSEVPSIPPAERNQPSLTSASQGKKKNKKNKRK